jgi:hypothetical protein
LGHDKLLDPNYSGENAAGKTVNLCAFMKEKAENYLQNGAHQG